MFVLLAVTLRSRAGRSHRAAEFRVDGTKNRIIPDSNSEYLPLMHLVYPGVYRVAANIPQELLAPGTLPEQLVLIGNSMNDVTAAFNTLPLPSN